MARPRVRVSNVARVGAPATVFGQAIEMPWGRAMGPRRLQPSAYQAWVLLLASLMSKRHPALDVTLNWKMRS
jgi:hypothetical protein